MRHVGEPNMEIGTPRLPVQGYLYKKSWVVALLCGIDTILGWIPQKNADPHKRSSPYCSYAPIIWAIC